MPNKLYPNTTETTRALINKKNKIIVKGKTETPSRPADKCATAD